MLQDEFGQLLNSVPEKERRNCYNCGTKNCSSYGQDKIKCTSDGCYPINWTTREAE